jgi:two-component system sensor histidine kinase HupT/HoxJ
MTKLQSQNSCSLAHRVGLSSDIHPQNRRAGDQAWIDVIHHMDSIYADLVHYQMELEDKNAKLEDAQSFIHSVISSISDILIVCDINGSIQQVNPALEEAVNRDSVKLVGKPVSSLFSKKDQAVIAEFPDQIRSGSLLDCELDLLNDTGIAMPMAMSCNARFDSEDRLSGLVITGRPLGELRKAYSELHQAHEELKTTQLQLIQSEKMASLGRLVAGVAHELNNPISFLFANMHALKGYQKKFGSYLNAIHADIDKEHREKLRTELNIDHMLKDIAPLVEGSMEGAERVSEIVQNLRIFTTPQKREKEAFDLIHVIERSMSWVLKAAKFKPSLVTQYPKSLKLVNNEGYVHQILINLIQNAFDAIESKQEPALNIEISQDQKQVHVMIKDNGNGISDENLVKIFDPFYTTKAVGAGTGLGLYISYGLATEQCHGDLRANNHEEGGAQFTLSLPLEMSL